MRGRDPRHPRREDRLCDRARDNRARSRARKRARRGIVQHGDGPGRGCLGMDRFDGARAPRRAAAGAAGAVGPGTRADGEPLTEELLHELLAAPSPEAFAAAHDLSRRSLSDYLNRLLEKKGLKRADVVRAAGINSTFGYQIFTGQRGAGRDKALRLAIALGCDLVETRRLLQAAGANELYCKVRRDAIIIFCIDRGYDLQRTDEELYRFGEETLGE